MREVIILQCRKVTADGVTREWRTWAQGYIDPSGTFRLKRCVGRYGRLDPQKAENPVADTHAA